jgi:hypothetical protein
MTTAFLSVSAIVRPVSTAARVIGRERKRSNMPSLRSWAMPTVVVPPPNSVACTRIPGMR